VRAESRARCDSRGWGGRRDLRASGRARHKEKKQRKKQVAHGQPRNAIQRPAPTTTAIGTMPYSMSGEPNEPRESSAPRRPQRTGRRRMSAARAFGRIGAAGAACGRIGAAGAKCGRCGAAGVKRGRCGAGGAGGRGARVCARRSCCCAMAI
jgi:hypothetical protein